MKKNSAVDCRLQWRALYTTNRKAGFLPGSWVRWAVLYPCSPSSASLLPHLWACAPGSQSPQSWAGPSTLLTGCCCPWECQALSNQQDHLVSSSAFTPSCSHLEVISPPACSPYLLEGSSLCVTISALKNSSTFVKHSPLTQAKWWKVF